MTYQSHFGRIQQNLGLPNMWHNVGPIPPKRHIIGYLMIQAIIMGIKRRNGEFEIEDAP
jgi:hypothetical protein